MADNYLENHYLDYLRRKEEWLKKKKRLTTTSRLKNSGRLNADAKRNITARTYNTIERPEDEAL